MKKTKIIAAFAVAAFAAVNVYHVTNSNANLCMSNLQIEDVAFADSYQWNEWYHWLSYGFTKDEREEKRDCPAQSSWWGSIFGGGSYNGAGGEGGVSGGSSQTNTSGRYEVICLHGRTNCTSKGC